MADSTYYQYSVSHFAKTTEQVTMEDAMTMPNAQNTGQ